MPDERWQGSEAQMYHEEAKQRVAYCSCHGLDSRECPGEDCLFCGAATPAGHVVVRAAGCCRVGRVCSSHTLKDIILSEMFDDLDIRPTSACCRVEFKGRSRPDPYVPADNT